jgi:hypothetical protein
MNMSKKQNQNVILAGGKRLVNGGDCALVGEMVEVCYHLIAKPVYS